MRRDDFVPRLAVFCLLVVAAAGVRSAPAGAQAPPSPGYFRDPALCNDTLVFTAEGDLWRVPIAGGVA